MLERLPEIERKIEDEERRLEKKNRLRLIYDRLSILKLYLHICMIA